MYSDQTILSTKMRSPYENVFSIMLQSPLRHTYTVPLNAYNSAANDVVSLLPLSFVCLRFQPSTSVPTVRSQFPLDDGGRTESSNAVSLDLFYCAL
jgi:hypothetical protein